MAPHITVIIPAYNEEDVIDECLESLTRQTYTDFKAVVVDDESTDSTGSKIKVWAEKFPHLIELKKFGKVGPGKARNLIAKSTESPLIAFMDADCVATPTWLRELAICYNNEKIASVGGPHLAPAKSSPFQFAVEKFFRKTSLFKGFYKKNEIDAVVETQHNPLCNVSYRSQVFKEVGGFREDLFPGEDTEIDFKVIDRGYKILYTPRALVHHYRPENIDQFKKVMHAYGRAQGKLLREYGVRRPIQRLGLFVLGFSFGVSILFIINFKILGLAIVSVGYFLFAKFRPRWNNLLGIYINSFQWFNGLIEGLRTNTSLPPGWKAPEQSNQQNKS